MERLARLLEGTGPQPTILLSLLGLDAWEDVQALVDSLLLSEVVYKSVGEGNQAALQALNSFAQQFWGLNGLPPGLPSLSRVQFSLRHVGHRYMLGRGPSTLYVCFAGTKELRDFMTDANLLQQELWRDKPRGAAAPGASRVHRGFLSRSEGVPIESLYMHALRQGLRLVLCGHSLGGAVAALCTLRLLATLQQPPPPGQLRCLTFGSPAIGNQALAAHVHQQRWDRYFYSYSLPEDFVPRLFLFRQTPGPASMPQGLPGSVSAVPLPLPTMRQGSSGQEGAQAVPGPPAAFNAELEAPSGAAAASSLIAAGGAPDRGGPTSSAEQQGLQALAGVAVAVVPGSGPAAGLAGGAGKLAWAAGRLVAAASTARTGASRLIPSYPSFSHFGQQAYLLPTHATSHPPASPAPIAASPAAAAAHRMFSYRGRVLSICRHAVLSGRQAQREGGVGTAVRGLTATAAIWLRQRLGLQRVQQAQQHAAIVTSELAPSVAVEAAIAHLPPLPGLAWENSVGQQEPGPSPPEPAAPGPGSSTDGATSTLLSGTARYTNTGTAPAGAAVNGEAAGNGVLGPPPNKWSRLRLPLAALLPQPPAAEASAPPAAEALPGAQAPALPAQLPLRVAVYGIGIESCTAASLRLPSGAVVGCVRLHNRAGRLLEEALGAGEAAEGGEGQRGIGGSITSRALRGLRTAWGAWQQPAATAGKAEGPLRPVKEHTHPSLLGSRSSLFSSAGPGAAAAAGLLVEFSLGPSMLVQLQQAAQQGAVPQRQRPALPQQAAQQGGVQQSLVPHRPQEPPLALHLLTDFDSLSTPVELWAQVVWLLGPEPALCQAVFQQLLQASEIQAKAVASLHPSHPRRWLWPLRGPSSVAPPRLAAATAGARGLGGPAGGNASSGASGSSRQSRGPKKAFPEQPAQAGKADAPQGSVPRLDTLPQVSAGKGRPWLAATAARLRLVALPVPVPQALAQGLRLVDASAAAVGSAPSAAGMPIAASAGTGEGEASWQGQQQRRRQLRKAARRLGMVASVLNRKALQRLQEWRRAGLAGVVDQEEVMAELAEAEVGDEDLAMDHRLNTGAKLRRRVSQAIRSARHRALLLRRWPALRDAPYPNILLLTLPQNLFSQSWLLAPPHVPQPSTQMPAPAHPAKSTGPSRPNRWLLRLRPALAGGGGSLGSTGSSGSSSPWEREAALLEVLSELQRVVALAGALGVAVLLVLVGPAGAPLLASEPARRRLAASVGLEGGLAAVVSVPFMEGGGEGGGARLQLGPLQAALQGCAAGLEGSDGGELGPGATGRWQGGAPWRSRL